MNLSQAMATDRPIAYPDTLSGTTCWGERYYIVPDSFMAPDYVLHQVSLTPELVASDKWYVKEPEVTITRSQFWQAACAAYGGHWEPSMRCVPVAAAPAVNELARRLGLEPST